MSVHVTTSPSFSAESPRLLFEGPGRLAGLMPEGDRFLVQQGGGSAGRDDSIRLVTNWFSEVAEKMRN
jgi:hypothetical protein